MSGVPFWVQGLTALSALCGPIIAYVIASKNVATTLRVARRQTAAALDVAQRQVHANIVSANRQKWIDSLREDLAAFITESNNVRSCLSQGPVGAAELQALAKPMILLFNRLRLRLNPNEADHGELIGAMEKILSNIKAPDVSALEERIAALGQAILKREWVRVKVGD